MRSNIISHFALAAALAAGLALTTPAFAEDPTAEDFIEALTPPVRGLQLGVSGSEGGGSGEQPTTGDQTQPVAVTEPTAAPSIDITVNFAFGSADLTDQARSLLYQLGTAMTSAELQAFKFQIAGHTDAVGSDGNNMTLSQRRAESVVNYLMQTFNIPAARLQSAGMGETHLLDPSNPSSGVNRRVEVINIGEAG